jgi:hypothetical protein
MERSPAQAAARLEEAFRESVREALCRLEEYRRTFDAAADATEALLRKRMAPPESPAGDDDGRESGVRITGRGYALFWGAVLAGAMASFAAGYWVAVFR